MLRPRAALIPAIFGLGVAVGAMVSPIGVGRAVAPEEPARPGEPPASLPRVGAYAADLLRVIDGDTFEARVHVWPGLDLTTKVRLRGIDAPEMKARCPGEQGKAEAARAALRAILVETDLTVFRVGLDKYGGRVLADAATSRTPDVSQALLQ